ncbi:MAG: adenylosuccinate lyase, partial [Candidatus Hydrothermarchaeales archaeon]
HPIDFRYGSEEMKRIFDEEARLQRFLDVEAALARGHAKVGNIRKEDADTISERANIDLVKVARVKEIEAETKHDLMAVVKALSEQCGDAGKYVHLGATSYDIVDTANALQFTEGLEIIRKDLFDLEGILLDLAEEHMETVAVGRTHGQHAVPTTYGMKFAIWASEIREHIHRIDEAKTRVLVGKMSGAVGTMASFGEKGMEIQEIVMEDLGLKPALVSSQIVQRERYAELISLLALISSTLDKMSREVRNLSRTEIMEASEKFQTEKQVGSSTMPHKRNPITAEKVCGLARVIKSNVFVALENVGLEHERDLTNSSCERVIIPESFILLDEILKSSKEIFSNLVLYPENIERNLAMTKGQNMAEAVMMALAKKGMGRQEGHELLRKLAIKSDAEGRPLREVLGEDKEVLKYLTKEEIKEALSPQGYIGKAVEQVKKVIAVARRERKGS